MTSNANARQVGGNHYDADLKHWDFVTAIGMQYLEGCATKHVARYDKKGEAIEDLEKATHYIEKTVEEAPLILVRLKLVRPNVGFIEEMTEVFCKANKITGEAKSVIQLLSTWDRLSDLGTAIYHTNRLLASERRRLAVPLEDSNKHALQPQDEPEVPYK